MQVGNLRKIHKKGFTLVELLIVIVVLGILVSISIVAYNGAQQRARDSRRHNDISELTKALEVYYSVNHKYPASGGSTTINNTWSTTSDASWAAFQTALGPYMDNNVPSDPISTPNTNVNAGIGYNYAYYSSPTTSWCGAAPNQLYVITYRLESSAQTTVKNGNCPTNELILYSNVSNYRMTRL